MKTKFTLLGGLLILTTRNMACAEEGGSGHYVPGSMSSFVDGVPLQETFIVRYNMVYYDGGVSLNEPLPITGLSTLGADATSWAACSS